MAEKSINAVEDNVVVSMQYTLMVDGEVYDSSEESGVIEFLQGHENIVEGLEKNIKGMKIGESKEIKVSAAEGYGEIDPEAVLDIPRSEFPEDFELIPGIDLELEDEDGEIMEGTIISVDDTKVTVDFNEPLAGKELLFKVTIVAPRPATEEELECGHIHGEEGCCCGGDCDCDGDCEE